MRYRSRTALAVDNTHRRTSARDRGRRPVPGRLLALRRPPRLGDREAASQLGLYGHNLVDKAYKTDGQEFSSVGNIRTVYYGAPRTFTLKLTARY